MKNAAIIILLLIVLSYITTTLSRTAANRLYLGIDAGTSGIRTCIIDNNDYIVYTNSILWDSIQTAESSLTDCWSIGLSNMIKDIPESYRNKVKSICVSGTSSSCLLYDRNKNKVSRMPRMYDYNVMTQLPSFVSNQVMQIIKEKCPSGSSVVASTSTLAKLLAWHIESPLLYDEVLVHQSDYLIHLLTNTSNFYSDWNNALKLGYDVRELQYPQWLLDILLQTGIDSKKCLPDVIEPGKKISSISSKYISDLSFPNDCIVVGGTTDSIAAFLASRVNKIGQAVTSLGSTIAIKLLSQYPVDNASLGVYSHRLGNQWLVGGASNVGCAILRKEGFTDEELINLSSQIDDRVDSPYLYYPLLKQGERFPVQNPDKMPLLDPKPMLVSSSSGDVDRKEYLHGLLYSMSVIEKAGYDSLTLLGASPVAEIYTAGGGAKNDMWMKMRQRIMGVSVKKSNTEASYGCALLSKKYTDQ